jgi:hypothetical protein
MIAWGDATTESVVGVRAVNDPGAWAVGEDGLDSSGSEVGLLDELIELQLARTKLKTSIRLNNALRFHW